MFVAAVIGRRVYDTIYAMVDRDDDLKIGVKSSAILFADMDRLIIGVLQAMMLSRWCSWARPDFGNAYYAGP